MQAFKSERAAKKAYTKADNAWKAMTSVATSLTWERRRKMENNGGSMNSPEYEEYEQKIQEAEKSAPVLFDKMREIYHQAESQWKHCLPTWHFGHNTTRDLIRANID
jgi:hypothetical protein